MSPITYRLCGLGQYRESRAQYSREECSAPARARRRLEISLPDGTRYNIDLDEKTGTSMKIRPETAMAMAAVMGPAMMKDAKTKDLPSRQVLDKSCAGKEVTVASMRITTRMWTWKGIPLRSEMESQGGGKPIVIEVSSLNVGPVPAEKFQVPTGVKIQDTSGNWRKVLQ